MGMTLKRHLAYDDGTATAKTHHNNTPSQPPKSATCRLISTSLKLSRSDRSAGFCSPWSYDTIRLLRVQTDRRIQHLQTQCPTPAFILNSEHVYRLMVGWKFDRGLDACLGEHRQAECVELRLGVGGERDKKYRGKGTSVVVTTALVSTTSTQQERQIQTKNETAGKLIRQREAELEAQTVRASIMRNTCMLRR